QERFLLMLVQAQVAAGRPIGEGLDNGVLVGFGWGSKGHHLQCDAPSPVAGAPQRRCAARISLLSRGHNTAWVSCRKGTVPRNAAVRSESGSTHRKLPARPKWPNVPGEASGAVQWGDLWPRISRPSPQS